MSRVWPIVAAVLLGIAALAPAGAAAQDTIEIDPEAEEAFFRGVGLLESGDGAAAIVEFDLAVSIQPDFRRAYYYRARAGLAISDYSVARQSAEAYSRFELTDTERDQLRELIAQIEDAAPPIAVVDDPDALDPPGPVRAQPPGRTPRTEADPQPDRPPESPPGSGSREQRRADALHEIEQGEGALEQGDCDVALDNAQAALRLDPAVTAAFRLKGLALECLGEPDRARALLLTWRELREGAEPDPVVVRALERIDIDLARAAPPQTAPEPVVTSTALGTDPRIEGVLEDRWGDPRPSGRRPSTRSPPGLGPAEILRGRLDLAGSRADAEVTRIYGDDGLVFSRLRVWGRSGVDTSAWFASAFSELYLSTVGKAGEPLSRHGMPDPRRPSRNAGKALAGKFRWEVVWQDDDGDMAVIRLGRCALPRGKQKVLAENQPCLEMVGAAASFKPGASVILAPEAEAVRLAETPAGRSWDLSIAIAGGFAPGFTVLDDGSALGHLELTLDLLGRFSIGAFAAGMGWTPGLGVTIGDLSGGAYTGFESRLTFYVGLRDHPRQPRFRTLMLGFGLIPDQDLQGNPSVAPVVAFRLTDQVRTTPLGQFVFSLEPYVVFGTGAVRVVPLRFSIGGIIGTKARLMGGQEVDAPRWE